MSSLRDFLGLFEGCSGEGNKGRVGILNFKALLLREHLLKNGENFRACSFADSSQLPCQPYRVYRAKLIKNDLAGLAFELAWNPRGIGSAFCCHRGYDDSADMMIHLVGRDNQAWTHLLDLLAYRRVQIH